MKDEKMEAILDNEREWRRIIYSEVKEIRKETEGLKVKVAGVAGFVTIVTTFIIKKLGIL